MYIIAGTAVDLITPFPPVEAQRIFGWKHCYRTLPEDDDAPKDREAFIAQMGALLPECMSAGIVDKGQLTSAKHEAPLVGMILLSPAGKRDAVLHFAAGRKAFKMGLVEEALALAIPRIFEGSPDLLRMSALLDESNTPAKALLKRLGFRFEGVARDACLWDGHPRNRVQFGLTRASALMVSVELPAAPVESNDTIESAE